MRVVITGMGVVSPVGCTLESFWTALCEGRSGIGEIRRFDTTGYTWTRAGEIGDFAPPAALGPEAGGWDRGTQFMAAAAFQAIEQAGMTAHAGHCREAGLVLGTNFGGIVTGEALLTAAHRKTSSPNVLDEYAFGTGADHLALRWGLGGPRMVLSLSCASGTASLGLAVDLIRAGRATRMVAGGFDALSPFVWSGLSALRTMTKGDLRPFDKSRDGTIFSEGAAALVLETPESAKERGARILAEIVGHAENNNAFHMTAPAKNGRGSAEVMTAALNDAGLAPADVDHINAHGTGTGPNDVTESQAIHTVFGARARSIPVTSNKSTLGHMMGAAGSAEAVASAMTLQSSLIPPTINLRDQDPSCEVDVVTGSARRVPVRVVLSNSAGIGGCNAAVVLRRWEESHVS